MAEPIAEILFPDPGNPEAPVSREELQEYLEQLEQKGGVDARDYGFGPTATAAENAAAIIAALDAANGGLVVVHCESDCALNELDIVERPADLLFTGPGEIDAEDGKVFDFLNDFQSERSVSGLTTVDVAINGQAVSRATRLAVANASGYQRGEVVKVVSADIDPDASPTETRRRGEFAQVVDTEAAAVIVTLLEDQAEYQTNVRVARLGPNKLRVRGLRVKSSVANIGQLYRIQNGWFADVEATHDIHGQIVCNNIGSYQSRLRLRGNGTTDSSNSLGYLVNDTCSMGTRADLEGSMYRHVYTTNHQVATAGDVFHNYGATRDCIVTGKADQCWGAPWDEHQGARRITFENCHTRGMMDGFFNAFAFQMRGRDGTIINPVADRSVEALVEVDTWTKGTVRVINPMCKARALSSAANASNQPKVIWVGGNCEASGVSEMIRAVHVDLHIHGGRFALLDGAFNGREIMEVEGGRVYLHGPMFEIDLEAGTTGSRVVSCRGDTDFEAVTGRFTFRRTGGGSMDGVIQRTNADIAVAVKVIQETGNTPNLFTGSTAGVAHMALVNLDDPAQSETTAATFAEYSEALIAI